MNGTQLFLTNRSLWSSPSEGLEAAALLILVVFPADAKTQFRR